MFEPVYRSRPSAEAMRPASAEKAEQIAPGLWCSPGLSNAYLLTTGDGRVIINTGMGFEGPVHRANFDAVDYIRKNHEKIVLLHLKDRKKNDGDNTPWGEGDTPIKQVLQLLKTNKYPIPAFIEYEYKGAGTSQQEVAKCYQYCKEALA